MKNIRFLALATLAFATTGPALAAGVATPNKPPVTSQTVMPPGGAGTPPGPVADSGASPSVMPVSAAGAGGGPHPAPHAAIAGDKGHSLSLPPKAAGGGGGPHTALKSAAGGGGGPG